MQMIAIPNGTFTMGSPASEPLRNADEKQHQVKIQNNLYFSKYETTVAQFRQFVNSTGHRTDAEKYGFGGSRLNPVNGDMNQINGANWRNPNASSSDSHPVVQISWNDATAFANWLSKKETGKTYRLPTEAEWEYAVRAGTQTTYSSGNGINSLSGFANISDQAFARKIKSRVEEREVNFDDGFADAAPVGRYRGNRFGLHDMHGNVWEWCYDTYDANFYFNSRQANPFSNNGSELRILRGGCYF